MELSNRVIKHNDLIKTSYQLNKREQLFILYLISRLDSINESELKVFDLSLNQIKRILNYDGVRRIAENSQVFDLMIKLNETPIHWEDSEEEGLITWISEIVRNKKTGKYAFYISERLKKYLLQLKGNFTGYKYENIRHFGSRHSIRIYEILKSNEFKKRFDIMSKFRFWLALDNKYPKYYHMNQYVLQPAHKEINEHTDITFTYQPIKEGRNITKIHFEVKHKATKKQVKELPGSPRDQDKKGKAAYEVLTNKVNTFLVSNPEIEKRLRAKLKSGMPEQVQLNSMVKKEWEQRAIIK